LRVVATSKNTYELRFFQVNNDEADQEWVWVFLMNSSLRPCLLLTRPKIGCAK
jgi:hypothetical protein